MPRILSGVFAYIRKRTCVRNVSANVFRNLLAGQLGIITEEMIFIEALCQLVVERDKSRFTFLLCFLFFLLHKLLGLFHGLLCAQEIAYLLKEYNGDKRVNIEASYDLRHSVHPFGHCKNEHCRHVDKEEYIYCLDNIKEGLQNCRCAGNARSCIKIIGSFEEDTEYRAHKLRFGRSRRLFFLRNSFRFGG